MWALITFFYYFFLIAAIFISITGDIFLYLFFPLVFCPFFVLSLLCKLQIFFIENGPGLNGIVNNSLSSSGLIIHISQHYTSDLG